MNNIYSGEMINNLFNDEIFLLEYNEYIKKNNNNLTKLKEFINSIQLNNFYLLILI